MTILTNFLYSHIALPIHKPSFDITPSKNREADFTFDSKERFKDYSFENAKSNYLVSCDDQGQWYFFTFFLCKSLEELKLTRQVFRPAYLKNEILPLKELLKELNIIPIREGFDKAYGHVFHYVPSLTELSNSFCMRLANYDGPDDPIIVNKMNFIQNEFEGQKTRYISGFETRSFATITENEYYAKEIHIPFNANYYLKLFIYFSRYGLLPSHQMMPRFLGNLWASTQMLNTSANPSLYETEEID